MTATASTLRTFRIGGQVDPAWPASALPWTAVRAVATLTTPDDGAPVIDPTNGAHEHPLTVANQLTVATAGGQWCTAPLKPTQATNPDLALQPSGLAWTIEVSLQRGNGWQVVQTYVVALDGATDYAGTGKTITVAGSACVNINALIPVPITTPASDQFVTNVLAALTAHPEAIATDLSVTRTSTAVTVASSTGADAVLPAATSSLAGQLTAADKAKLDTITALAQKPTGVAVVTDYGAVAGGTFQSGADCTTAFQDAINALITAGGGVMIIPPGNWRITQPIKITGHNITVMGYGDASTILMDEAPANITASTPVGGWSGVTPIVPAVGEFRNSGLFQCWAGNLGAGNGQWGSSAAYNNLRFQNFRILGNSSNSQVDLFDNYQSAGIDFANNAADCLVQAVTFQNLRGFAVHARGNGTRHHVIGCRAYYVGNSLVNHGTSNSVFAGNILDHCEGLEVSGARIAVTGNVLSNCVGIAMGGNPSAIECGSVCANNSISDARVGIYVGTGMSDSIVIGNTIMRTVSFGISVAPGASSGPFHVPPIRTQIVGNLLRDIGLATALGGVGGTRHAIFINDTTDVVVAGNSIVTHDSTNRYSDSGICLFGGCDQATIRDNVIDVRTTPLTGLAISMNNTNADVTFENNQLFGLQPAISSGTTFRATSLAGSHSGATSARPGGLSTNDKGYAFFDETLGTPIWWNGSAWKNASGTTV